MKGLKCILFAGVGMCFLFLCFALSTQKLWLSQNQIHKRVRDPKDDGNLNVPGQNGMMFAGTVKVNSTGRVSPALYYCNFPSPENAILAEEGRPPNSTWILKQVQFLIRHGDRSPIGNDLYKKLGVKPTYCKLNPDKQPSHPSLQKFMKTMAEDFTRMRTQGKGFPSSPYPNEAVCGSATLSQLGVVQHLHQGELLRKVYIEKHRLLSDVLSTVGDLASKVFVSSTMRSRTIQSAVAFLYGFLPDFHLGKVPIQHAISDLFRSAGCPSATAMQKPIGHIRYNTYVQRQRANTTFRKIADLFGVGDHSGSLIDGFVTGFLCKNLKLPCVQSNCTTVEDLDILLQEETHLTRVTSEQSPLVNQSMLTMHPLLTKIDQMMLKKASGDPSAQDVSLFSGHDTTLKPMIRALGIPEYRWPKLGTRLVFELWFSPEDKEHYVRILLNGKDYTGSTECCQTAGGQHQQSNSCSYRKFHSYVENAMQQRFGAATLKEACKMKT